MEILITVGSLIIGFYIGWHLRELFAVAKTRQVWAQLEQQVEEEQEELLHIVIEKHNDMLYVYDKETKQFMAQGSSKEDIEKVLIERFPGKRFACHESTLKEVGFIS